MVQLITAAVQEIFQAEVVDHWTVGSVQSRIPYLAVCLMEYTCLVRLRGEEKESHRIWCMLILYLPLYRIDLVGRNRFGSMRTPLTPVSYTHLRAHETPEHLVCRLL